MRIWLNTNSELNVRWRQILTLNYSSLDIPVRAVRSRLFVERPRPTDPSVGFCRIPTRSGPTDRPTVARSAAKIRVGPIDRPTRPRAARRKIDGRDRPTDRPCRAQRGAKFTVGTDRPTDPKQLDQVGRSAPTDRPTRYPPRGRSTNNLLRTALRQFRWLAFPWPA